MKTRVLPIALLLVFVFGGFCTAQASPGYLTSFNNRYTTGATRLNTCSLCHTTTPRTNAYGAAYANNARSFPAIEGLDSDGDGFTNLQEIKALTFPGNAADKPALPVLSSLTIQGAGSVNEGATSTYSATASYNDGTSKTVSATWSLTSAYASISAAGILTANQVTADQTVTINASFTEGGVTKTATLPVTIVNVPPVLSSLTIQGAGSVNEGATSSYSATASYNDGTSKTVSATWSLTSAFASISADGVLTANQVNADQIVTINASFTEGGVTKTATLPVTIVNVPPVLSSLTIQGAGSVNEGATSTYSATASYNDGTSKTVSATWSLTSAFASISAAGVLTANQVNADQIVTINASFTEGGVTKTATLPVTIVNVPPVLSSLTIQGAGSVNEGATSTYSATASYNDGTSKTVSATWSLASAFASISAAGVLTANQVSADQTVTINASYTEGGVTKTATLPVTIVNTPLVLSILAIQGAGSVNEGATSTYSATASYNDGTSKTVSATWSLASAFASISAAGVLTANQVSADQTVTINASYTEGGVTRTATLPVTIVNTPLVLSTLAIQGAGSVNEGATSTYSATASYNDGTSKTVSAAWSLASAFASISAAGVLTANQVSADQTVTINASYTEGGVTRTATLPVTIVNTPLVLSTLAIQGAGSVNEGATSTYSATASYNDGTSKTVSATWSLASAFASISAAGVLTANQVSADQTVTINASYTEGGVTKTATLPVTIVNTSLILSTLAIQGAGSVNEGATSTYSATASYNDGTSKTVSAAWSLASAFASISAVGVLTANQVNGDQTVTINASYTEGGVTKTATKTVGIINLVAPPKDGLLFSDDFSDPDVAGSPYWEIIHGRWYGNKRVYFSAFNTNSILLVRNVPALEGFVAGRLESKVMLNLYSAASARQELAGFESQTAAGLDSLKVASSVPRLSDPNATIVFGYLDNTHYRYVNIRADRVAIGQVGNYGEDEAGLKAVVNETISLNTWRQIVVDVYPEGSVRVYVDHQREDDSEPHPYVEANEDENEDEDEATVSYSFKTAMPGRVGYRVFKAKSRFDDFKAWDETVLPVQDE